jgi:uncharacterized protein
MNKPVILRKRYIPFETIDISGDELLFRDEDLLITKWKPIKPREDLSGGISFTFLKEGYKISKFFDKASNFLFWYCDIIEVNYEMDFNKLTLTDLLVDIKVFPDGHYRILDIDELSEALEKGLVSSGQVSKALHCLSKLLNIIYDEAFPPEVCRNKTFLV